MWRWMTHWRDWLIAKMSQTHRPRDRMAKTVHLRYEKGRADRAGFR